MSAIPNFWKYASGIAVVAILLLTGVAVVNEWNTQIKQMDITMELDNNFNASTGILTWTCGEVGGSKAFTLTADGANVTFPVLVGRYSETYITVHITYNSGLGYERFQLHILPLTGKIISFKLSEEPTEQLGVWVVLVSALVFLIYLTVWCYVLDKTTKGDRVEDPQ